MEKRRWILYLFVTVVLINTLWLFVKGKGLTVSSSEEENQVATVKDVYTILGESSSEAQDTAAVTTKKLAEILLEYKETTYDNYFYYNYKIKDTSNRAIIKSFSEGLLTVDEKGCVYPDKELSKGEVSAILKRLKKPLKVERPIYMPVDSIPILMYHEINHLPNKFSSALYVSKENFIKQLDALQEKGYRTITMDQLYNHWEQKVPIPKKSVILTFDDGYNSHFNYVYPELSKRGMTGTFFIVTKHIAEGTLKSPKNLKDMYLEGMELGSHTVSHLDLRYGSKEQVEEEIRSSKEVLSDVLGVEVTNFCYPIGGTTKYAIKVLKENNYKTAVKMGSEKARKSQGLLELSRIKMDYYDGVQGFLAKLR